MESSIGKEMVRKDAWLKVTGKAKYNDDYHSPSCLQARLLTSVYAHAEIMTIDVTEAYRVPGIRGIVTGKDSSVLTGSILQDMPILAIDKTRYFGEPVAIAIADEEWQALQAVKLIKVEYQPLPVVNSIEDALQTEPIIFHSNLMQYKHTVENIYPEENTNISNRTKIRKGDMVKGWANSEVVIEAEYHIPQANHAFMETRNARVEILPDGGIHINSATQAPHATRELIACYFNLPEGNILVDVPFVGGGFGGKVNPHPEMMGYIASLHVGGQEVRISLTREESFFSSACKIGAKAYIKLGADKTGKIQAIKADYFIDSGAYSDTAPIMARAAAVNCNGAYNIPNVQSDSACVYTNHVYTTSFRGFGHEISTFAMERTIEKLAEKLNMDSAQIRLLNAMGQGDFTPTQVKTTLSNTGNTEACINRLKQIMEWDNGTREQVSESLVRTKGMACFSKTSSSPTNSSSSAVITFCTDGCVNLNCSIVECGPGMTTSLPQILSQRLRVDPNKVFMNMKVNTHSHSKHWKTVASMSTYMAGNAILSAADDAIRQLKANAALALRCSVEDLEIGDEKVYLKEDSTIFLDFKSIVNGVKEPNGNARGGPVIGRGSFTMKHLSILDQETGKGQEGPYWTVGAQGVELEYDLIEHTFRLVRGVTVLDAGKVIQPTCAMGQVMGGMNTGLSLATREINHYAESGELKDTSFRTYKMMHYAENPNYSVEFIETPNISGPYGSRGLAEHSVLGMPPALANAFSKAVGVEFDIIPITFESIWNAVETK